MLSLFPDEKILTRSNDDIIVLTTHRICYESKQFNRAYNQSIMLEHITSCENSNTNQNWLLVVAAILVVLSISEYNNHNPQAGNMGIFGAVLCGIVYYFSRRNLIVIASPSTKMRIPATGMSREQVLAFINRVEQAKYKRLEAMR